MKYAVGGFFILVLIMMARYPNIFFKVIDDLDAKIRRWAEWILK